MSSIDKYIEYISSVRRYSKRTQEIYSSVLEDFAGYAVQEAGNCGEITDAELKEALTPLVIRGYIVELLETRKMSPRTVNLHISVLSGFCGFLMKRGLLTSNPARSVPRPKQEKRLPVAVYWARKKIRANTIPMVIWLVIFLGASRSVIASRWVMAHLIGKNVNTITD